MKTINETYKEYADVISESVSHFETQIRSKTRFRHTNALAHGRVIEQFATAMIWKLLHPDIPPPSIGDDSRRRCSDG